MAKIPPFPLRDYFKITPEASFAPFRAFSLRPSASMGQKAYAASKRSENSSKMHQNLPFLLILKQSLATWLAALLCMSCQSQTATGAFTGGVIFAGIGGVAGGGKGALIGTTAGLVAGGLLGAILDEQDRKVMERTSPRTVDRMDRKEPLTLNDVIKLSQGGVSDEVIIRYIQEAKSPYHLSRAQTRRLQEAGVSSRVIEFMIGSGK